MKKAHSYSILRVPTTQLAKMSIDLKFVELTADVLEKLVIKYMYRLLPSENFLAHRTTKKTAKKKSGS